ncbi:hypothetical protein LJC69_03105 [Bacteroidales bacterium OttesenSCG-928-K22]|nr:hypothetical protein [Bacteroidales bacterium OttesenSCG-928-L14]MDL2240595.1 hypothetical protein [Bacteroidales bacterium OttesenSCG-928-K22]
MSIDKLISENKSSFNIEQPIVGHEQRFEQRLQEHYSGKKKQRRYLMKSAVAAALVLLLLIPLFIINNQQIDEANTELADVKKYYQSKLENEIRELQPLLENYDEELRAEIIAELEKIQNSTEKVTDIIYETENIPNETLVASTAKVYINSIESVRRIHNSLNEAE